MTSGILPKLHVQRQHLRAASESKQHWLQTPWLLLQAACTLKSLHIAQTTTVPEGVRSGCRQDCHCDSTSTAESGGPRMEPCVLHALWHNGSDRLGDTESTCDGVNCGYDLVRLCVARHCGTFREQHLQAAKRFAGCSSGEKARVVMLGPSTSEGWGADGR